LYLTLRRQLTTQLTATTMSLAKLAGLGTLAILPADIRRLLYRSSRVATALCRVSHTLYNEVQPRMSILRRNEEITGEELCLYLKMKQEQAQPKEGIELYFFQCNTHARSAAYYSIRIGHRKGQRWSCTTARDDKKKTARTVACYKILVKYLDSGRAYDLILDKSTMRMVLEKRLYSHPPVEREEFAIKTMGYLVYKRIGCVMMPLPIKLSVFSRCNPSTAETNEQHVLFSRICEAYHENDSELLKVCENILGIVQAYNSRTDTLVQMGAEHKEHNRKLAMLQLLRSTVEDLNLLQYEK